MKLSFGRNTIEITHENKLLFPKSKITKKDLALYYQDVSEYMLPLIKDRPISLHRFPQGIGEEGFFQKNVPEGHPAWVKTVKVHRQEKESIQMVLCNHAATLLWLVNQNCITPHIWLSRIDRPEHPDRLIFDLDPPPKKGFEVVVKAAQTLREVLEEELHLPTFVNTTGSKGLHLVVPIKREWDFEKTRHFAHGIAELLVKRYPDEYTIETRKDKRRGRVYIDTIRNAYGQTVVAPYAVRAIEGAPIATPLHWEELKNKKLNSQFFHIGNIRKRLSSFKNPWALIEKKSCSLKRAESILKKLKVED